MNAPGKLAVFYAQASPTIGGGHVMRCLTLADRLRDDGWRCLFSWTRQTRQTVGVDGGRGHGVHALEPGELGLAEALRGAAPDGCDLLVVDDYGANAAFESECRGWARRIMVIDDLADREHDCDVLLDQTLCREEKDYRRLTSAETYFLLGPDYALLRPEFARLRADAMRRRTETPASRRILVSLGMTDPLNATTRVLDGIELSATDVEVDVVLGSCAPYLGAVRARIEQMSLSVRLHIDCPDLAELMTGADLAIGAAGGTAWERCCLGLPTMMVVTAANQETVAAALARRGAALSLGYAETVSPEDMGEAIRTFWNEQENRISMSKKAMSVCDGRGVARVVSAMFSVSSTRGGLITSRPVRQDDRDVLFEWQSMPGLRKFSRNANIPSRGEHDAWFTRRLAESVDVFEMLLVDDTPAGIVRLDPIQNDGGADDTIEAYEVSILVAPAYQGQGVASIGLAILRNLVPDAILWAYVDPANTASLRVFAKAGYERGANNMLRHEPRGAVATTGTKT